MSPVRLQCNGGPPVRRRGDLLSAAPCSRVRLRYKGKGGGIELVSWNEGVNLLDCKQQPLWQITLILAGGLDDPRPEREAV